MIKLEAQYWLDREIKDRKREQVATGLYNAIAATVAALVWTYNAILFAQALTN